MNEVAGALPDVVRRWQNGWGVARGLRVAEEAGGTLRVVLGKRAHHRELVVLDADADVEAVRAVALEVAASGGADWLTVPTNRFDEVAAVVREAGLEVLDRAECLMARDLGEHPAPRVRSRFVCGTVVDGALIETEVRTPGGDLAARGTMAVVGADAVAHNIETWPEYRRQGLASGVMGRLVGHAVGLGATTGLLIASAEGQRLYSSLGWTRRATILVACA